MGNWIEKNPLISASLIVIIPSVLGIIIAAICSTTKAELSKALYTASVTLIFAGFFGGVLKILLDNFNLNRQKRADEAMFVTNVLNDLKSVYDRVERVRVLIPAHKSALTYGNGMRDLIDARVTLKNVVRALKRQPDALDKIDHKVLDCINDMEGYLKDLTDEFKKKYKTLADLQRIYEQQVDARLKQVGTNPALDSERTHEVWEELNEFAKAAVWQEFENSLEELMELTTSDETSPDYYESEYYRKFEKPLDDASGFLRQALQKILGNEGNGRRSDTDNTRPKQASTAAQQS